MSSEEGTNDKNQAKTRALDKQTIQINIFLISPGKHALCTNLKALQTYINEYHSNDSIQFCFEI